MPRMPELRIIEHSDHDLRAAYCRYVRAVFPRAGFERWIEWGEWNPDYRAFALTDAGQIVANVGLTRMRLLLAGREVRGWQLGAVGVIPERRGWGYSDRVMAAALAACGDDPVLLFANPRVREFYPRYGFAAVDEAIFVADFDAVPAASMAAALDPESAATRALIHRLAEEGIASTAVFGARGHGRTLTWYLANGFAAPPRQLDDHTLVVCHVEGECLHINDILARERFDLAAAIPRLIDRPIRHIRFGFTPELWWPQARVAGVDPDPHLFVRGLAPNAPHKFPLLAQT